jgi:ElaB/YqjD/DUF883 family membrane-anchored ribosome-binding protein
MGEDPGTAGAAITESSNPRELRREVETTREELGDTVAALAAKTDVKAQAKQKLDDTKASITEKKDGLLGKAKKASPQSASTAAGRASEKARDNPLPMAVAGGFAFGFLAAWLMRR